MVFQTVYKALNILLVVKPIILVLLYLSLSFTKTFIELLDILLGVEQLSVVCDLLEVKKHFVIKLLSLLNQDFLDGKEIPVLSD
jgi:hypothetical protein